MEKTSEMRITPPQGVPKYRRSLSLSLFSPKDRLLLNLYFTYKLSLMRTKVRTEGSEVYIGEKQQMHRRFKRKAWYSLNRIGAAAAVLFQ